MAIKLINDVAHIRTGYTFRKAEFPAEATALLGLQISDTRDTTVVDPSRLSAINWQGKGQPPILQPGDVVIAAKGSHNRAAIFLDREWSVVPSNQFLVLSVRDRAGLLPEFLCWVLNFATTQQRLTELQSGSGIPSISKQALQALTIPLPPLQTQQKILHINSLWEEEESLTRALLANRASQMQGLFQTLLSERSH